ncbi:L,D-transpeptidase [Pseudonocardia sp. MH-G8]|uniref:L,D-transpeptidase n=1 Tax=Pseudonocardia sp. MH-G8 TaxID=1854588 RepID=UPI001179BE42|nr:L,D-transpeptidase [Pseudonocardia sp. MH-G8]
MSLQLLQVRLDSCSVRRRAKRTFRFADSTLSRPKIGASRHRRVASTERTVPRGVHSMRWRRHCESEGSLVLRVETNEECGERGGAGSVRMIRGELALRAAVVAAVVLVTGSIFLGRSVADVPERDTSYRSEVTTTPDGTPLVPGTPCTATARACVDLASHNAWLLRDGAVIRGPVKFVDGDAADPTPRGTYAVEWKAEQYTSREYLVQMPYSVFFAPGGIAFHEGGQSTPSAGCVKLVRADAVAFFNELQVGDEVQVK